MFTGMSYGLFVHKRRTRKFLEHANPRQTMKLLTHCTLSSQCTKPGKTPVSAQMLIRVSHATQSSSSLGSTCLASTFLLNSS